MFGKLYRVIVYKIKHGFVNCRQTVKRDVRQILVSSGALRAERRRDLSDIARTLGVAVAGSNMICARRNARAAPTTSG